MVGLLTKQVAKLAELQTALKRFIFFFTSVPMMLCCDVGEGSKTYEEGLVGFT